MANTIQTFLLNDLNIRGAFVHIDSAWQEVLKRRTYPSTISELLGQATVATLLMSSHIKFDGKLILQLQSEGDLSLMVVQNSHQHRFRSLAKYHGLLGGKLTDITDKGIIAISIEANNSHEPYQGLVGVTSDVMAENIETYFQQSEQLQTVLVLRADNQQAAGLLLQTLPESSATEDDWMRLRHVSDTLNLEELNGIDSKTLIGRIFAEDDVIVHPAEPVAFECNCSPERTLAMLSNLSIEELKTIVETNESITIECEFCGQQYVHNAETISTMING